MAFLVNSRSIPKGFFFPPSVIWLLVVNTAKYWLDLNEFTFKIDFPNSLLKIAKTFY